MASASYRLRSDSPVDRWSNETSVDAEIHPIDLDQQNDRLPGKRPSRGKRGSRPFVRFLMTFCVGVAATLAWQSYGDVARETIAISYPQLAWMAPQGASLAQAASDAAAPAELAVPAPDPQEIKAMSVDLAAVRQSVDRLAAELAAGHQQMAGDIATLQAAQQAILRKVSAPAPRPPAAPPRSAVPPPPSLSSVAPPAR
jgi:hypothetical protein